MLRAIILSIIGILFLSMCGLLIYLYWEAYGPLQDEQCKPLIYPSGQKTTQQTVITTTDSITTVLVFYDERLNINPDPNALFQWHGRPLKNGGYSYSCDVIDQHVTTEAGCIEIHGDDRRTQIEIGLYHAEGAPALCPKEFERVR